MSNLNDKIIEAIKLIASEPGYTISFNVKPMSEKKSLFNEASDRILIDIELVKT